MKSNLSIFTVTFFLLFFYSIEIIELLGRRRWVEMAFYISGENGRFVKRCAQNRYVRKVL